MSGEPTEPDRMTVGRVSGGLLVAIGLLFGLAVGVVVAWALDEPGEPVHLDVVGSTAVTVAPESAEAAEAFIEAWERSRRATFVAVTEWHRVTDVGAEMTERRVFAQRLPDRVRSGDHSRRGQIGGIVYTCDQLPLGDALDEGGGVEPEVECRETPADEPDAETVDEMVEAEVELMWRHVVGTRPLYRVGQRGNCFFLRLDRAMVVPPYGFRTAFCFDAHSGAVSDFRIDRVEGTDTERLLWVRDEVTDDDLRAIIEGRFEMGAGTEAAR
jgi:hypothetical protein